MRELTKAPEIIGLFPVSAYSSRPPLPKGVGRERKRGHPPQSASGSKTRTRRLPKSSASGRSHPSTESVVVFIIGVGPSAAAGSSQVLPSAAARSIVTAHNG